MALENFMSQMGIDTKQMVERYSEHAGPVHDHHVYYAYEPSGPPHDHSGHVTSTKHNYGSGFKSNASMSALTLLAFLFFLHILQQCIKDHMNDMTTPPLMVMSAGREGEENISKAAIKKIDKTGVTNSKSDEKNDEINRDSFVEKYETNYDDDESKKQLTRIDLFSKTKDVYKQKYENLFPNDNYKHSGHINAMEDYE
ncbi:uncharacterized protein LOC105841945 [Bombyx mori]|uniref:Uncharacterized protein n=1 Tax=Bombyx mori TaxID=7091 RepID=A0A8R2G970_BOMMO|nr:uncharacterized protein LOC105841945 [Bombyx mori]